MAGERAPATAGHGGHQPDAGQLQRRRPDFRATRGRRVCPGNGPRRRGLDRRGGESTRPGSSAVSADEQIRRTADAIKAIRQRLDTIISIDTREGRVAERAADEGANVVNDISAGRHDPEMFAVVARRNLAIILLHMQGTPQTMQEAPAYSDVTAEVGGFLVQRRQAAVQAGIDRSRILVRSGNRIRKKCVP